MRIEEYHDIMQGQTKPIRLFVENEDEKMVRDIAKTSILSLLQNTTQETICVATIDGKNSCNCTSNNYESTIKH